jgi:NitT/TauT family transport system substrate-binding protein
MRFARIATTATCLALSLLILGSNVRAATPLRIGTPGFDGNAMAFYASERGTFTKYGVDADVQIIRAGSGAGIVGALAGGSLDIGEGDITAVAAAREHGIPLVLLAPSFLHRGPTPLSAMIVAKDSPIRSAKDLDGKVVAVPSLSGPNKLATQAWLEKNGADMSTIKFIEMPQTSMPAAIDRGTVAAGTCGEPVLTANLGPTRVLSYPYDAIGNPLQVSAWFATEDWVKNNQDVAKRFVAAMHETAIWADNPKNHPASGAILEKYNPFPMELLGQMHRAQYGDHFDVAIIQPLLDTAYAQKSLQHPISAQSLLSSVALTR